jgi:methionine sulfoxide reductase heme-binding subunit
MGTASAVTGVISMVLLTAVVALGILVNRRTRLPGLPKFASLSTHRFVSLLAVGFLAIHILTAVIAPYANVSPLAAVIPFSSHYDAGWLGLGAVAADLMLALIVTSLLRRHIGYRLWRAVHWLAYACWPTAFAHSIGTGGGMRAGRLLELAIGCAGVVVAAASWRLACALPTLRSALRGEHRRSWRSSDGHRPAEHDAARGRATPGAVTVRVEASAAAWSRVLAAAARAVGRLRLARAGRRQPKQLAVNPIACTGYGLCADLLPELIALDHWGYPVVSDQPVPPGLARRARRTVSDCPALALLLADIPVAPGGTGSAEQPSGLAQS